MTREQRGVTRIDEEPACLSHLHGRGAGQGGGDCSRGTHPRPHPSACANQSSSDGASGLAVSTYAVSFGSATGDETSVAIGLNTDGSVFVGGNFDSPTFSIGGTTLTNKDGSGLTNDFYVVKYDATGTFSWAKSWGGTSIDSIYGLASDGTNAFIVGHTTSTTSWAIGTTSIYATTSAYADTWVAKLDSTGAVTLATRYTGTNEGSVSALVA
jgi:hypothetical protein